MKDKPNTKRPRIKKELVPEYSTANGRRVQVLTLERKKKYSPNNERT